mmetsp:Transcript_10073/g.16573  ORF Transcript_10073/g.16573 Transcript_10073/m.16573 type:complete len:103 (-) Transcript_10073:46-354(-)
MTTRSDSASLHNSAALFNLGKSSSSRCICLRKAISCCSLEASALRCSLSLCRLLCSTSLALASACEDVGTDVGDIPAPNCLQDLCLDLVASRPPPEHLDVVS